MSYRSHGKSKHFKDNEHTSDVFNMRDNRKSMHGRKRQCAKTTS